MYGRRSFWPARTDARRQQSVNAMCYLRGHPADYDEWAALGNPGWSYADVLPYFKRSRQERGASAFHGVTASTSLTPAPNPLTFLASSMSRPAGAQRRRRGPTASGRSR